MACPPLSSDVVGGERSTGTGTHTEDSAHRRYPPPYAVSLALPGEYVKFGSVVQMIAPDVPASRGGESGKLGLVLAGLVGEKEVDCIQHFVHGCALSASPLITPCVRNAFIVHRNKSDTNTTLLFLLLSDSPAHVNFTCLKNCTVSNEWALTCFNHST
uniref:(California timema) hypothetical protein n=1 Tax=Timema californicum TaxID=61474 RepID=A0A7R9PB94_TIMCA|nr:unnamed protein product [Timema californicum]